VVARSSVLTLLQGDEAEVVEGCGVLWIQSNSLDEVLLGALRLATPHRNERLVHPEVGISGRVRDSEVAVHLCALEVAVREELGAQLVRAQGRFDRRRRGMSTAPSAAEEQREEEHACADDEQGHELDFIADPEQTPL
jgi:hypothetical protein